jgi:hypothetical protein
VQIQINSDKNIVVNTQTTRFLKEEVDRALGRFKDKLTRLEIHLSDVNGPKFGKQDTLCLIEARPAGRRPLAVSMKAATVEAAARGSLSKLRRALETLFGRLSESRTRVPQAESGLATPRPTKRKAVSKKPAAKPAATVTKPATKAIAKKAAPKKIAVKKVAVKRAAPKKKAIYQARRKPFPAR